MRTAEIRRKLRQLIDVVKDEEKILILMHDNPDPDSIASAIGLQFLLVQLADKPCLIAYAGIVGRAENRAMLKYLGIRFFPLSRMPVGEYHCIALVDTQPMTGNNSLPPGRSPKIVFDHHPIRSASRKVAFRDIKPKYNVTASIITEYLLASRLTLDPILATALFYAIKSETEGLGREVGKVEARLRHILYPRVDQRLLANIENARVSREYFKVIHSALEHARICDDVVFVNIGKVKNPDKVAEVADLLMRLEGVKWSFCFGTYNGDMLVSARTVDRSNDAGLLLRRAFRDVGAAGGHEMMAGAKISFKTKTLIGRHRFVSQMMKRLLRLTGYEFRKGEKLIP
jgi:nanoRNase/pAp phosphatase (c-di-AMP/oligoRNAs hydrolase)